MAPEGGQGSASRPGRPYPGKDPVPIAQEAGWAPGPVWTGAENLASTGIRSPDRPARNQSLYRLSYRALGAIHETNYYVVPRCQLHLPKQFLIMTLRVCSITNNHRGYFSKTQLWGWCANRHSACLCAVGTEFLSIRLA